MINAVRDAFQFLLTYTKRQELELQVGKSFKYIQGDIEKGLKGVEGFDVGLKIRFADLGGVNNLGMFIHFNEKNQRLAVSKVQRSELADREFRFLKWQKDLSGDAITANVINYEKIERSEYSWISFSNLNAINDYSDLEIKGLFQQLDFSDSDLISLASDGSISSLVSDLEPTTKIKRILRDIVCVFPSASSIDSLTAYFEDRESFFKAETVVYDKLLSMISILNKGIEKDAASQLYGLVHGDFKKQNIMQSSSGKYKVIDLQYYTYGVRLWDLAFYYSKSQTGFVSVFDVICKNYSMSEFEKFIFVFFFIVASSLHLKKKNADKTIKNHIKPAINYCCEQSRYGRGLLSNK